MPAFAPFRGVRFDPNRADLATHTAPPYDVIDEEERAALLSRAPDCIVRIDLPAAEGGRDPYEVAPALLSGWLAEGLLMRDAEPAFYVYRLDYVDDAGRSAHTTGVMGALHLERPGEGGILPHEHTTPKAKSDRLRMLEVCEANLSPVWGLAPAPGLTELLEQDDLPAVDFEVGSGTDTVRHRLWVVHDTGRIAAIADAVGGVPIVIADGHHRYETSLAYRDDRRAAVGTGPWDQTLTWIVELTPEQLGVRPIHRLVTGLDPALDLPAALEPFFTVGPCESAALDGADDHLVARLVDEKACALVTAEGVRLLHPRPEAFTGVRDLDTARLDHVAATLPGAELHFQHGVEHVVRQVVRGDASAGVLLRPVSVDQILEIAHGGERMPPKSTFFHPKLRTGLVLRLLDE